MIFVWAIPVHFSSIFVENCPQRQAIRDLGGSNRRTDDRLSTVDLAQNSKVGIYYHLGSSLYFRDTVLH
jgi:hypothetical protein